MLRGGMVENNLVAAFTPTIAHALHYDMDAFVVIAPALDVALYLFRRECQQTGIVLGHGPRLFVAWLCINQGHVFGIERIDLHSKITYGPLDQLVRSLACHARGHRFKSGTGRQSSRTCNHIPAPLTRKQDGLRSRGLLIFLTQKKSTPIMARIAQLVERQTENLCVGGSIPSPGTKGD